VPVLARTIDVAGAEVLLANLSKTRRCSVPTSWWQHWLARMHLRSDSDWIGLALGTGL